jgi:hypothetical protein
MSTQTFTPFGYRYENDTCNVKLRLSSKRFAETGLEELGNYRTTNNGYVIFEASFSVHGDRFKEFNRRMRQPAK